MNDRRRLPLLAFTALGAGALVSMPISAGWAAAAGDKVPVPRARPAVTKQAVSLPGPLSILNPPIAQPPRFTSSKPILALASAATAATPSTEIPLVKQAIDQAQAGKISMATEIATGITDPLARKLVEWVILRSDDGNSDFSRLNAFLSANPSWPSASLLRRRAEAALWQNRLPSATVRAFFAQAAPLSAKGSFALARALLGDGDAPGALAVAREAWRTQPFSRDVEEQVSALFGDMFTSADHKARMDDRLNAEDGDAALRAANRLGGPALMLARARIAVLNRARNAKALLDAVPSDARRDAGWQFAQVQLLRRSEKFAEAGKALLSVAPNPKDVRDPDQWWVERRIIARKLLDAGDAQTAYRVVRDAVPPQKENWRVEHQFLAGWIAFRFLHDPATALPYFARIAAADGDNPHALSRGGYWQGRALEALGREAEARAQYESAARFVTTYYGQLARARLGRPELALRPMPGISAERRASAARLEIVRAVELLYAVDERNLVVPIVMEIADRSQDVAALAALGDLAARNQDARAMLLLGKKALERGYAFEQFAFPTIGIPDYRAIGPAVERSLVYAIARQESTFNPQVVSSAKAYGLMQVTSDAARYVAKRWNATFDQRRLMSDPVYNVQLGAAELGGLLQDFNGSYVMTFVGYNAGRRRVRDWIAAYGDPRDPKVDVVDWVERIPFAETRNYVERVMENLQVYRARFGSSARLTIEADLRRGGSGAGGDE